MRKKQRMTFWMEAGQIEGLKALSAVTRIPQAVLMREAIDMLLSKYHKEIRKAPRKGGD
jgi:hypothetical protein